MHEQKKKSLRGVSGARNNCSNEILLRSIVIHHNAYYDVHCMLCCIYFPTQGVCVSAGVRH